MRATFGKAEKLKSKKLIEQVFAEGRVIKIFPIKLIYVPAKFEDQVVAKAGVSVGKKNFKRAVDRNRIKRLLREAYRLNKNSYFNNIPTQYALMFMYIGKEKPEFAEIDKKMKLLLKKFMASVHNKKIYPK